MTTATIYSDKDATHRNLNGTITIQNSTTTTIPGGYSSGCGSTTTNQPIFHFDLSSIGAGAVVSSVVFNYGLQSGSGGINGFYPRRVNSSWTEVDNSAGPTMDTTSAGTVLNTGGGAGGYTYSDATFTQWVIDWITGATANNGFFWYLSTTAVGANTQIYSREDGAPSRDPFLTIVYTPVQVLSPTGLASAEAFGTAAMVGGPTSFAPTGIATGEAIGTLRAALLQYSTPTGIGSGEAVGSPAITKQLIFSQGIVANGNESTSDTSLVVTFTKTTSVGDILLCGISVDNLTATTPTVSTLVDSRGNTWTQIVNSDAGTATAAGGVRLIVWQCTVTTAHQIGDTLTATLSGAVTAKSGAVLGLIGANGAAYGVTTGRGTAAQTGLVVTAANVGDFIIGVGAFESNALPAGDSDTLNGTWSAIAGDHSTGGTSASNTAVGFQVKQVTATGNQTWDSGYSGDHSVAAFGFATVPANQLAPTGIASGEAFGSATISSIIAVAPTGIATGEAMGADTVVPGPRVLSPTGLASAEAFGVASMYQGTLYPVAIASAEALGNPTIVRGVVALSPTGIATGQAVGVPAVSAIIAVTPTGIASAGVMGNQAISTVVVLSPTGIASAQAFGVAVVNSVIAVSPVGIASAQAFGAATLINYLSKIAGDSLFIAVDGPGLEATTTVATDTPTIHIVEASHLFKTFISGPPPDEIMLAAIAPVTRITRRVDIYEADGTTPFMLDAPFMDGSVTIDSTRDERRMFDLQLYNEDGSLTINPDGFWYDKIIKLYRGIRTDTVAWERKLGEFMIDQASNPHFPDQTNITGRDMTKKMLLSKLQYAETFAINTPIENIIHSLAINSGIPSDKIDLPLTGKSTGKDFSFDRGTERWNVAKTIANAYGYDLYFTNEGVLTMTEFADPTLGQPEYAFTTGPDGQIESYEKRTADARLYNHIIVTGDDSDTIPVWAEAKNEVVGSPTSIARIGDRSFFFTSSFITTYAQALDVANKFLKVHALEQFEASLNTVVLPWLDAGIIVDFIDPDPADGDPTRYLLSSLSIPLSLGSMPLTAKRVTEVV